MGPQMTASGPSQVKKAWIVHGVATLLGLAVAAAVTAHGIRYGWTLWHYVGIAPAGLAPLVSSRLAMRWVPDVRPAIRRYNARLTLNMVVYFVLLAVGVELYRRGLATGPWGYFAALLPVLPTLNIFLIIARLLREETDELQRQIVMTSLVWAGAASLAEAMVWGFLEMFGKAPHLWLWVVPVAFFAQLGITMPLASRKYR